MSGGAHDIRAINQALRREPLAVVLMYQSYCSLCNATKPHMEDLAQKLNFTLVSINCDHISPEAAGTAVPSLSVFKYGLQTCEPLRGTRPRKVLVDWLLQQGVITPDQLEQAK